ncbi:MAG: excinuclease ABC subunit A [Flavobacteriales bacterium]|nr:MAG: excinuclease ABC subunit A [Flavobacteriales bacterium]
MQPQLFSENDYLEVIGAREHNLKDITVSIPRNRLVVITGLSGSGKSSLAFDTIYAEGQRRYIETFSAYARQFLGSLERPDVDKITGLNPVISIEQKTVSKNPRSTVGTVTEIYDFLRLLYARISDAYSYISGEKMVRYSDAQIVDLIMEKYAGEKLLMLAPLVKGRKGHYRELFEQVRKQGFLKVRIDGKIIEIEPRMQLDRYKIHDIEVVVDKIEVSEKSKKRISDSLQVAMKIGKGTIGLSHNPSHLEKETLTSLEEDEGRPRFFSRSLMCPTSGISYPEPEPNSFSFNSPYGACPKCNGLGKIAEIDFKKIIPKKNLSIKKGGIAPLGEYKDNWTFRQIEVISEKYGFTLNSPVKEIPEEALNVILYGSDEIFAISNKSIGISRLHTFQFEGITNVISSHYEEKASRATYRWANSFMNKISCPECDGSRLKKEALYFKIDKKNIADLTEMDISDLQKWFDNIEKRLSEKQNKIAAEVLKEIRNRIQFLMDVGLDYLTLNRSSRSLSGGEAQRIRLATQIGSQLVGVLYILDEPSIGLHQRDNARLIQALKDLRDIGNSVIVVEHDKEIMLQADHIIDLGPHAGRLGGEIIAEGSPEKIKQLQTLTAQYLNGEKEIEIPKKIRKGTGKSLVLIGASGNNLKEISVEFPLGKFICVTGVSGSGKSTLVNETLYRILHKNLYRAGKNPLPYQSISGLEHIDKVIEIDQSPIGRTPRSNPATYTGVFTEIRALFSHLPEAKIRGYKPGRFSFNVKGGRCETCQGAGLKTIEMNFLPDVYVHCETCNGRRYNRETMEVRYKGKSIGDVLEMTINQSVEFFEHLPAIYKKLKCMQEVGLGYVKLGQQSTTISGGEAQRVKLATELSKKDTGKTFYILDEPTTGLHFEDIRVLLEVLNRLVSNGNTVVIIEHNLEIIKVADHIIDLGPEGGSRGGEIICTGTPGEIVKIKRSYTGEFLKKELKEKVAV